MYSYLEVGHGLEIFEKQFNLKYFDVRPTTSEYRSIVYEMFSKAPTHVDFLNHLNKGPV